VVDQVMRIIITGVAGFIGMHQAEERLKAGHDVLGIDNLNAYYDVRLKEARLAVLARYPNFRFEQADIAEEAAILPLFSRFKPDHVLHLAAQAGVRHSLKAPRAYTKANIEGFLTLLEAARHYPLRHLVYASSSSVYGANTKLPFAEEDAVNLPVSLYAATKRANELMAQTYAHLFAIPMTGLRFFTVYGPWGRPDMAPWLFTEAIRQNRPISVYDEATTARDFTYIDDVTAAIGPLLGMPPQGEAGVAPHRILNIGNNRPVPLADFIRAIEAACGESAIKHHARRPPGDVAVTFAAIERIHALTGFSPKTTIEDGMRHFVSWYDAYQARTG